LVEQLTFNQLVAGSNPARPTNTEKAPFGAFFASAPPYSRKLLDHILRRIVLDENLRSGSSRAKRDDNAQRCPQGEAQGRVNPARPTNTEKAPFGAFFASAP
jgi:hypothetical protein